jgi:hypothetical protein
VSDTPWTLLQAPFPRRAITWDPLDVSESGDEAWVAPRLTGDAVRERLDTTLGVSGWSVTFAGVDGGIICTLRVGEVTKSAVADHGRIGSPSAEATADRALARAAAALGLLPPVATSAWVPFDRETGAILVDAIDLDDAPARDADAAATADRGAASEAAPDPLRDAAEARGLTSEAQEMIDRLVERLKDEGQGLAAARLLVKHGGYGSDPVSARELYSQLRSLLLRTGARVNGS